MSFDPNKNDKDANRKSGFFGSLRDKLSRTSSRSRSSSSNPAPPPGYASSSSTSYGDTSFGYNNYTATGNAASSSYSPPTSSSYPTPCINTSASYNDTKFNMNDPTAYNTASASNTYPASYSNTPTTYYNPTPYSNAPTTSSTAFASSGQASSVPQTAENPPSHDLDGSPFALLSTFDTVILIDDSSSMAAGKPSSWEQVSLAIKVIAPIITAYDDDGVDVYFINHKSQQRGDPNQGVASGGYYKIQNTASVEEVFRLVDRPYGSTNTGKRINHILSPYMKRLKQEYEAGREVKPLNLIVITDGEPTDEPEYEIVKIAKELDKADAALTQLGIQFFQVGTDPKAKKALEDLDDALENRYGIRDMVDTVTWTGRDSGAGLTGDSIVKAVLGAVIKKLDRRPASGERPRD
ncbi:hypothetical protein NHQ30_004905 [Ciborinia camelliae]|nr:hypothetical protein NHQ30_004905 [Ciborinia camelliae]